MRLPDTLDHAIQTTNGKPKVDFLITAVADGTMLLSPTSERAEAWVDSNLPNSVEVDGTIAVHPELVDDVVDALGATEMRIVLWRTRIIRGVRVNEVRTDGVWVRVDERKALLESLMRYMHAKHRATR